MTRHPTAFLTAIFLSLLLPSAGTAHELGIARVSLDADDKLVTVTAWLAPAAAEIPPLMPAACAPNGSSVHPAPRSQVQAIWEFRCDISRLDSTDRLVAVWPIEGIFLSVGNSVSSSDGAFFDAEDGQIRVPLRDTLIGTNTQRDTIGQYFAFGVEHILTGWDHLVFVLLLCLIATGWTLVKLVTAFTIGHSVTLAAAATGWINVPGPPVEACIALSIVIVAREAILQRANRESYLIIVAFGLLHGLGFAGALREAGFESAGLLTSLLGFNLGVEVGQLLFVAAALIVGAIGGRWLSRHTAGPLLAYSIGGLGVFWVLERTSSFYL